MSFDCKENIEGMKLFHIFFLLFTIKIIQLKQDQRNFKTFYLIDISKIASPCINISS